MHKIKVFEKANAVLGVLKGDFTLAELEKYISELKFTIKTKLKSDFSYILDISEFYTSGFDGTDSVDKRMGKLRSELEDLGMTRNYILGAGMKTFMAIKRDAEIADYKSETLFCESLDEVKEKVMK